MGVHVMSRRSMSFVAVLGLLSSGGVAFGQGQVVSYFASGSFPDPIVMVDPVPAGGLVVTDIATVTTQATVKLRIVEVDGSNNNIIKLHAVFSEDKPYSLRSGLRFEPGTRVEVLDGGSSLGVSMSGYVPSGSGSVPAISAWGLGILGLCLLLGATLLMRRQSVSTRFAT